MGTRPLDPRALPSSGPAAAGPGGGTAKKSAPDAGAAGSPAFHVLLERLQATARELQEKARGVEKPAELAGAVDRARQSLDDALDLGGRLLEAWRSERQSANPKDQKP